MPGPGATTARGSATRARLLGAARQVVAEVGYPRATTKAIADAAGVAEGTIYRHFPDKHAMFLAAVADANQPVVEWMTQLHARAGQGTVAGNLGEAVRRLAELREHMLPLELAVLTDPELARRRLAGVAAEAARRGGAATASPGPPGDRVPSAGRGGEWPAGLPQADPPTLLAHYLAAEQKLGRVRPDIDPARAAVTILALLIGLALVPDPSRPTPPIPAAAGRPTALSQLDATLLATAIDLLTQGLIG